jgi:membrane-bound ClpP family serine protease
VSPAVYVPAAIFLASITLLIGWFAARTKAAAAKALAEMKGGGIGGLAGYVGHVESLAGADAVMSPFGKVLIRGELWDFVSEDSVRVGDPVQVVRIDGLRAIVKPVQERLNEIAAARRGGIVDG